MPVADYHVFCRMLDRARERHYALPAVNATSLTTTTAVLRGLAVRKAIYCVFVCLILSASVFASEVVLKNVKVVKGDLVSQYDSTIIIEDATGIEIDLKKAIVDVAMTEEKNAAPPPAFAPAPEAPKEPEKKAEEKAMPDEPKKPARVYVQEDIERLRRESDLGEGSFSEEAGPTEEEKEKTPEEQAIEKKAAAEAQRRQEKAEFLRKQIEEAQKVYDTRSPQCEFLKTTFIQRWQIKDQQGKILPYYDTIKMTCDEADKAKNLIEKYTKELSRLQ